MNSKPDPGPSLDRMMLEKLTLGKKPQLVTPFETDKLTFTLIDARLQIHGPRDVLEKMARKLRKMGVKRATSPYGA